MNWQSHAGWPSKSIYPWAEKFFAETGVKINVIEIDYQFIYEKLMLEAASPTGAYDIIWCAPLWANDLIEAGYLIPMNKYIDTEGAEWKDILAMAQEYARWGDTYYGYPCDGDVQAMYYRKDVLEEKGVEVPKTWDDLMDAGDKLQDPAKNFYGLGTIRKGFFHGVNFLFRGPLAPCNPCFSSELFKYSAME